ncbi:MAG: penicillin acylase family protein [Proteobacteria bacterium]|nr:penicillin acylase family protein [Pseudomonadota bacterium]
MRWAVRILVTLGVALVVMVAAGYLWLRGSLPEIDGTTSVAGLSATVEIVRDRHGVPHIVAQSQNDAFFGLGYAHAQDRLWQMEINRRIGAGRLSELTGPDTLPLDRNMRVLGVYRVAEQNFANLDAETRSSLEAYAKGVNAFIATRDLVRRPLPPEFIILGIAPEPWTPADSLVWGKMMALSLNVNMSDELLRAHLAQILDPEQLADIYPGYPHPDTHELGALSEIYKTIPWIAAWRAMTMKSDGENGSNNWVVAGRRTATGKPLLANDPHLGLSVPSIWYLAHLSAPGLETIGATLPGIPAILIGRNSRIAWGFTNTYGDVQDVFLERTVKGDRTRYESPEGPRPFEVREEVITVKDSEPVRLAVRATRHGPVISDLISERRQTEMGEFALALAWTALDEKDTTARATLRIQKARSWDEFIAALRDYAGPQQNMVYADVDGHIGFYAPAKIPLRAPDNKIRGALPVPGWDATYDWMGFLPFEELPHEIDPSSGTIATANNAIVDDRYPHHITFDWEHPYRIRRIRTLLDARSKHSIDSFREAQGDNQSTMARDFLKFLLPIKPISKEASAALGMLKEWDGDMDLNRPEPLIFSHWYSQLETRIYADELGSLFRESWHYRPLFLHRVLSNRQVWCDDVTTDAKEDCAGVIAAALQATVEALTEQHGDDLSKWRWGDVHYAHMKHLPFTFVPVLNRIFDIRIDSSGGPYTINRGGYGITNKKEPFAQIHGASFRAIYDLDDLNRSLYVHTTGQSGNPLSSFFDNLVRPWRDIDYIPMTTERRDYSAGSPGTLVLTPSP